MNNRNNAPEVVNDEVVEPVPEPIEDDNVETFDDIPDEEGIEIEEEKEVINNELQQIDRLNQQLEEAQGQVEKEKKEYLYLMAEFDNFRKRTIKEKSELIKNASEGIVKDLLPIVDDFERAIEANKTSEDVEAIKSGVEIIYNKLMKLLDKAGVKAIDSADKDFDPDLHEAIAMVPGDASVKGKVIDTLTKGYTLNDKVIRHAKVAVGQ